MSGEIGHLTLVTSADTPAAHHHAGRPPAEAREAVDAAFEIAEQLAQSDRELHFVGGGYAELRTLDGTVIRRLTPAEALDVMCGAGDLADLL
jgi:hypothetical protein